MPRIDSKMSRRERLQRCKRTLTKPKRRKSTANNAVRYSINYESLMSGEGGKGIVAVIFQLWSVRILWVSFLIHYLLFE